MTKLAHDRRQQVDTSGGDAVLGRLKLTARNRDVKLRVFHRRVIEEPAVSGSVFVNRDLGSIDRSNLAVWQIRDFKGCRFHPSQVFEGNLRSPKSLDARFGHPHQIGLAQLSGLVAVASFTERRKQGSFGTAVAGGCRPGNVVRVSGKQLIVIKRLRNSGHARRAARTTANETAAGRLDSCAAGFDAGVLTRKEGHYCGRVIVTANVSGQPDCGAEPLSNAEVFLARAALGARGRKVVGVQVEANLI